MTNLHVICAWCSRDLGGGPGTESSAPISHGICESCLVAVMDRGPEDLATFLDRMDEPVLLVNGAGFVVGANYAAQKALNKSTPALAGLPGGDVVECAHARLPGGCGHTVHCAACTLRGTVTHTHRTGEAKTAVQATMQLVREGEVREQLITFTTERVGGIVWLRLDKAEERPRAI